MHKQFIVIFQLGFSACAFFLMPPTKFSCQCLRISRSPLFCLVFLSMTLCSFDLNKITHLDNVEQLFLLSWTFCSFAKFIFIFCQKKSFGKSAFNLKFRDYSLIFNIFLQLDLIIFSVPFCPFLYSDVYLAKGLKHSRENSVLMHINWLEILKRLFPLTAWHI